MNRGQLDVTLKKYFDLDHFVEFKYSCNKSVLSEVGFISIMFTVLILKIVQNIILSMTWVGSLDRW